MSLGRTAAYFHSYSLCPFCPFWSPKASIFTCKAVSFIVIESIFRLIVSVSMLTALPTASIKTGSLVRLWTKSLSLIQSAKYLLSWYRIGRYLQCPPRKESPDIRFTTSPMHPSYSRLRTSRQEKQVPQNLGLLVEKMVSIALRDQLIKSIIF